MKVRKVEMTDHEFAAELRNRNAINNYRNVWNMTLWEYKNIVVGYMLYNYMLPSGGVEGDYLVLVR